MTPRFEADSPARAPLRPRRVSAGPIVTAASLVWILLAAPIVLAIAGFAFLALFAAVAFGLEQLGDAWALPISVTYFALWGVLGSAGIAKILRGVVEKRAARREAPPRTTAPS